MTAKTQMNALSSAVHVLKSLAENKCADANAMEEKLRDDILVAAKHLQAKVTKHFDMADSGLTEAEWDAIPDLTDHEEGRTDP